MNLKLLKLNVYARYATLVTLAMILYGVPLPINRWALLGCCLVMLGANVVLNVYVLFTKQYRTVGYLLLVIDLVTVIPAIYISGFIVSPFLLVLPLTLYSVYFIGYSKRITMIYGLITIASLMVLFGIWWFHGPPVVSWDPREYVVFSAFLFTVQLASLLTVLYQSRQLPDSLIQELERQEAVLERQQHRAELGASLSMISHEIRNPLTTAALGVEYVREMMGQMSGPGKQKALKHLRNSEQELFRIGEMLESVLSYAREKRGQYNFERHDIKALIMRATEFMKLKYGHHKVAFQVDYGLMDHQVFLCDRDAMHQVLVNLLDNAIQHRDDQRPLLLEFRVMKKGEHISLTLRDNGKGISSDKLPYIFERFVTGRAGGTGIGLSIVKQIINDHHGDVEVQSIEGAGTTFCISMPVPPSPSVPVASGQVSARMIKPATVATKSVSEGGRA